MKQLIIFGFLILMAGVACTHQTTDRPNIILILADDFGYMDMQAYAEKLTGTDKADMYYETPNLNGLVSEGMAFSRAYACQLCSPTRASILSGKYAGRLGFTTALPPRDTYYNQGRQTPEGQYPHDVIYHYDPIDIEQAWINASSNSALPAGTAIDGGRDVITLAEAMPEYHSAFIGKWHLGGIGAEGYQPADQGFEPIAWYDAGGSPYFNWRKAWNNRSKDLYPNAPQDEWMMGDAGEETGEEYLTDDLTAQALHYLDERAGIRGQPFFLYFCHFAVHGPWQAKAVDSTYFANKDTKGWNGHDKANYAGMVRALDSSVGAIMAKLEETGLDENTLVIFFSDNGGWDYRFSRGDMGTTNAPLRGGKACLSEGGIRVPLIFYWKGKLGGGQWCDVPVDCTDLYPTILEVAGYDLQPYIEGEGIDGKSILPLLWDPGNDDGAYRHDTRYWHYPFNVSVYSPFDGQFLTPRSCIMEGNYKLIFDWQGRLKLFDLAKDLEENHNLAKEMPEKTKDLYGKLMSWMEENVDRQYWPKLNPDYNPSREVRKDAPFVDIYTAYKAGRDIVELAHE
jgi:arylsulfatase A-like enzyme